MTYLRKRVVVLGDRIGFNHSIASLLADADLDVVIGSRSGPAADCILWAFDELGDLDDLFQVATQTPTVVIGDESHMMTAIEAGVRGFVLSGASLDETGEAVHVVLEGGSAVPPALLGTLLRYVVRRQRVEAADAKRLSELTQRERDVYELAVNGTRKDEIAERLFISPGTVRTHLQRVYRKLDVHSQAELIATRGTSSETQEER